MPALVRAMGEAFASLGDGTARVPERAVVPSEHGTTLVMGAWSQHHGLAAKVVSVFPDNRQRDLPTTMGLLVALDPQTGQPIGLLDGATVTAWRTGAASGLATELLAPPSADTLALIGCGAQARTQLLGVAAVRPLRSVWVYGPRPARVKRFIDDMQASVQARLHPADSAEDAVRRAAIVCAATSSTTPVFDGTALPGGVHINAVGAFRLDMHELDVATYRGAQVFVDHPPAAAAEAGGLMAAVAAGASRTADWTPIGEVFAGREPARRHDGQRTLFKSVGLAVQDVAAASVLLAAAEHHEVGQPL